VIYTHVAAVLLGLALGGTGAWQVQSWRADRAELKRVEQAKSDFLRREKAAYAPSVAHEQFKEKERVAYVTIIETVERLVERPVYRNICLDADGVRAYNAAARGAAGDPGEPGPAVRAPD